MTTLRTAAQQALEALNRSDYLGWQFNIPIIKALRAALAEPVQEPVAHSVVAGALFDFMGWLTSRKKRIVLSSADDASPAAEAITEFAKMRGLSLDGAKVQDWNTAPSQRKPLTEEEISAIDWKAGETLHDFARAIEKAHGIGTEACATLAEPHTGVMLKPVLYANRRLTNEEVDAVVERKENT